MKQTTRNLDSVSNPVQVPLFTKTRVFIKIAGALLFFTSLAKLLTAFAGHKLVYLHDPVLGLEFRFELMALGIIELLVACLCLFSDRIVMQLCFIAWLATNFLIYRFGLWWVGGIHACPCLGNFADAVHISQETANNITHWILIYLFLVSYGSLFLKWVRNPA